MLPSVSPAGLFHDGADTVFLALFYDPWLYSGCYSTFLVAAIALVSVRITLYWFDLVLDLGG